MNIRYFPKPEDGGELPLRRRGYDLGCISVVKTPAMPDLADVQAAWDLRLAIRLPGLLADALPRYAADIAKSHKLMRQTLDGVDLSERLEQDDYQARLLPDFNLSGSSLEDHDDQAIEKVIFDAWQDDDIIAENLWCKASWLSFDEADASLRFRFSFGFEGYEDVAADPERQGWAAKLTDAIFPESAAVTEHEELNALVKATLGCDRLSFAERIVYFNAPNGGAQFHHDVERGHDGVVFAQMSGSTFWLALSKARLMDEIDAFLADAPAEQWPELRKLAEDRQALSDYLEERDHDLAEELIDREPGFFRQLIEHGYAHVLRAGDVLLMPQQALDTCVWHSVVCLGDEVGEGLSFALKRG